MFKVSESLGYPFGGTHVKDSRVWGFVLGSPYFEKPPYFKGGTGMMRGVGFGFRVGT